jgi:hypothetical protein
MWGYTFKHSPDEDAVLLPAEMYPEIFLKIFSYQPQTHVTVRFYRIKKPLPNGNAFE